MTKKNLRTIVFSFGLAAMLLLPTRGQAQAYDKDEHRNSGAFYELIAYDTYFEELANLVRISEYSNRDGGIGLGNAETENPTPVGSGIAILTAIGAGYALLKRKEDKQ